MKLIFLDRDGVINKYPGDTKYVTDWNEFEFLPGVLEAIRILTEDGFKIFVASNQAGVSKGIYTQEKLEEITKNMLREISSHSGKIQQVLYCTHTDEDNCSCRKPKTGMITKIVKSLGFKNSANDLFFFVGDSIRDIKTGKLAGCRTILVFSGKEKPENRNRWEVQPDYQVKDLKEAVQIILNNESPRNLCHGRSRPPQGS
jgi:D-glycero-D-manno-heptose 1,7-bisphosphate phosphatase